MKLLSWLGLKPRRTHNAAPQTPPAAQAPFCVIGDPHGRHDLLVQMLDRLQQRPDAAQLRVICAGDMVDRGPDTAAVLRHFQQLSHAPAPFAQVLCLRGNHEEMLLEFLADPARHGARWLAVGGTETLLSFGISPHHKDAADAASTPLVALRDRFACALGSELQDWLMALPLLWQEGDWAVVHAGANPRSPMSAQTAEALVWGHAKFRHHPRQDGVWIAHGHRIVPEACVAAGRVAVDTGAYRSNRLSAAVMTAEGVELLYVSSNH